MEKVYESQRKLSQELVTLSFLSINDKKICITKIKAKIRALHSKNNSLSLKPKKK